MPGTGRGEVSCNEMRDALASPRALTAAEAAHAENCEACLEAWLEATVLQTLNAKPEVQVPADFAARVVAGLPEKRHVVRRSRSRTRAGERHWGLITAILLVAVGLLAAAVADPAGMNTRMGAVFIGLVVSEIAGIALWLGSGSFGGGAN